MSAELIETFALQEFRLRAVDSDGAAARIVAGFSNGIEPSVPLLTSIDDERDVATVRALHGGEATDGSGQRAALDPLVSSWQPLKRYGPRITERAASPPSHYRLAVTESGINDGDPGRAGILPTTLAHGGAPVPLGLLWIGVPVGTHAGLMILLGSFEDPHAARRAPDDWPLPMSGQLGVRIYEGPG